MQEELILGLVYGMGVFGVLKLLKIPIFMEVRKEYADYVDFFNSMNPENILPQKMDTPKKIIKLVGHTVPPDMWWESNLWEKWLMELHKKGGEIRIVAGPQIHQKSREKIGDLVKEKIIKFRKLEKIELRHFVIVDDSQLWIEEKHPVDGYPQNCTLAKEPYSETMQWFIKKFEELWESGTDITSKEDVFKLEVYQGN